MIKHAIKHKIKNNKNPKSPKLLTSILGAAAQDADPPTVSQVTGLETAVTTNAPLLVGQVTAQDWYPVAPDGVPIAATVVPSCVPATTHPRAVHAAVFALARQVFSLHVVCPV